MRNDFVSHFSYDFRFNHYIQFTGLCAYPPVRFPKLSIKTKRTYRLVCSFRFGTPIGNRTLVSAVRGRRLEPLDHEGKSTLLCDNIIILHLMQANADMFSQKSVVCHICFWRVSETTYEKPGHSRQTCYCRQYILKTHFFSSLPLMIQYVFLLRFVLNKQAKIC